MKKHRYAVIGISTTRYCRVTNDPSDLCRTCYEGGMCWSQLHRVDQGKTSTGNLARIKASLEYFHPSQGGRWRSNYQSILYWCYAHKETTIKNSRSR